MAAPQEFILVNNINVNQSEVLLKLRVIRVWRQPDRKNPNESYSIEMILIDENVSY